MYRKSRKKKKEKERNWRNLQKHKYKHTQTYTHIYIYLFIYLFIHVKRGHHTVKASLSWIIFYHYLQKKARNLSAVMQGILKRISKRSGC